MPEAEKRDSDRVAVGRQFPTQSVVLPYTQTKGGSGYINFRTRTGTGGLGEGLFSPQNLR